METLPDIDIPPPIMASAQAMFDFEPDGPDELRLRVGDTVYEVEETDAPQVCDSAACVNCWQVLHRLSCPSWRGGVGSSIESARYVICGFLSRFPIVGAVARRAH